MTALAYNIQGDVPDIIISETINPLDPVKRSLGEKQYELSNHLGNVLVTVSDRKLAEGTEGSTATGYRAEVLFASYYYPFGMQMPGRIDDVISKYRYGFNGKESDPEGMGGGGSTYDYGFRIYNPQIARFLSVDPLMKSFPWLTPYQYASNDPIRNIDIDGLEGGSSIEWVLNGVADQIEGYWDYLTSPNKPAPPIRKDDRTPVFEIKNGGVNFKGKHIPGSGSHDLDGSNDPVNGGGAKYGGKDGFVPGLKLVGATVGTILSFGTLSAASGAGTLSYGMMTWEGLGIAFNVDEASNAFYSDNRTLLTELGINPEMLSSMKGTYNAISFYKNVNGLIKDAASGPNASVEMMEMANIAISELTTIISLSEETGVVGSDGVVNSPENETTNDSEN